MDSDSRNQPPSQRPPEWAEIDASIRVPVLFFVYTAAAWLVTATVLGFVATVQILQPAFLSDLVWTTHGRIVPLARNAMIYGWGFNAAFAILLWMSARLCRASVPKWGITLVGALFWNVGVTLGLLGIVLGHSTGHFLLEMPGYAAAVMFVSYGIIGATIAIIYTRRREGNLFVAQWYGLAALFWFPWLFTIGQAALVFGNMRGTGQAIAAVWYGHNVYALFLAPIALGAIYYVLPKRLGRPITGYSWASLGFWSFALFATFGGLAFLAGSPIPGWVQALGVSANFMMLVPLTVIGYNFIGTMLSGSAAGGSGPALRFIKFGAIAFLLAGAMIKVFSVPQVYVTTQFTFVNEAMNQMHWYAFVTMSFFGAIYFFVPRMVGRSWPSGALITAHYWSSVAGIIIVVTTLVLAGIVQGNAINDPEAFPLFTDVAARYSGYLVGTVLGFLTLLVGQLAFLVNILLAIYEASFGKSTASELEALFPRPPALEVNS
jgi:cytochrome c oxidase cbb3-type subunit I